jgi:acetyltransferase-like isoleucine patch superfamily enzyme
MYLVDKWNAVANRIRRHTVYAGTGRMGRGVCIGRRVTLGSRRCITLADRVTIGDYCQLHGGKRPESLSIGESTFVHSFCILRAFNGYIHLGRDCSLNPYCVVYAGGGIEIGNCVRVGPHTAMIASEHRYERTDVPIYEQGTVGRGIRIEDDVWIGVNCSILDGVTIGRGAIVGAGAVVTKDVEPYSIVAGVPARVIRSRVPGETTGDARATELEMRA